MPMCSVLGCNNCSKKTKDVKYFSFPKDDDLCKKWLMVCKHKDRLNTKHARICSIHFHSDDFVVPLRQRLLNYAPKNCRNLRKDAVPTEHLSINKSTKQKCDTVRQQRLKKRKKRILVQNHLKEKNTSQQSLDPQVDLSCIPGTSFENPDTPFSKQTMASSTFEGLPDRFNGITVYSKEENCEIDEFSYKLNRSLELWQQQHKRCIWFKVFLEQTKWVPILVEKGFKYHHAKDDFVMLYLWLPKNEISNIPPYAHTMIGVGAVVVNQNNQLLVVNEKYYNIPHWKLPGGYVEPGENLIDAAIREVHEETNIKTTFNTVLCSRHTHNGMFDCSDIYTVINLIPLDFNIKCDNREIQSCKWMDINEFLIHPHVHELNRFVVRKYLEYKQNNIKINWLHGIHQILNKPYTVYFAQIDNDDNTNNSTN